MCRRDEFEYKAQPIGWEDLQKLCGNVSGWVSPQRLARKMDKK